jgi:hypothetical protein
MLNPQLERAMHAAVLKGLLGLLAQAKLGTMICGAMFFVASHLFCCCVVLVLTFALLQAFTFKLRH